MAATKTLADFNTDLDTREWDRYTLRVEYAVIGWQKTHLGRVETVIAERGEHKPGTYKVGDVFSSQPSCNQNGQHKGHGPRKGLDTQDITCLSCRKRLGL